MLLELTKKELQALKKVIGHELFNYMISRNQHIVPEYQDWYDMCDRLKEVHKKLKELDDESG